VNVEHLATDFDAYREAYGELSHTDRRRLSALWAEMYPDQRHADHLNATWFFERYSPERVIELGGWDGYLALCMMSTFACIRSWRNYEIAEPQSVCSLKGYRRVLLGKPIWEYRKLSADSFVATHVIEHLSASELSLLIPLLDVKTCLIEAPLEVSPRSWRGQLSSHVLEVGWDAVDRMFAESNFAPDHLWSNGRFYIHRH